MDLEGYLRKNNIWHRFIEKPETIHTKDAAKKAGIELKRLTKSLIMVDSEDNPILGIIPGNCKLDFSKVGRLIGGKKVGLVPFKKAEKYSGYLPGATPMVHHRREMKVILDKKLTEFESIIGGGGTRRKLLELKTSDVIRLNKALVEEITE